MTMKRKLMCVAACLAASACTSEPPSQVSRPFNPSAPADRAPENAKSAQLERVDPTLVCMVNNQYMGKPQIPVAVDGKTYFGCCEMCKSKLEHDRDSRFATDPTSGASVDKAKAVIGKTSDGTVLYFENEANLKRYTPREGV
jgi:YHS domain-containing protein